MNCIRCGKKIENGSVCAECLAQEAMRQEAQTPQNNTGGFTVTQNFVASREAYGAEAVPTQSRMAGFGLALTGVILGFFGFIFSYIAFIFAMIEELAVVAVVLTVISLPFCILPIIFGFKSIGLFRATKAPNPKPIPGFVCGIVGLSEGAFSLLFVLLSFAMMALMSM